ncbi:MAG: hypothetical protein Q7Q71_06445 [Verrucomicrobiota bacterium JB023]|nr:hypothetical protein [Verrucomicrobiota bacterium JB023]
MKSLLFLLAAPAVVATTYTLELDNASTAAFIELTVPTGTEVKFASHGGSYDESRRLIKWGPLLPVPGQLTFILSGEPDGQPLTTFSQPSSLSVTPSSQTMADGDDDGLPDSYEAQYQLDSGVADAHLDHDGDGLSTLAEFFLGTNPRDPSDSLQTISLALSPLPGTWTVSPRLPEGTTLEAVASLESSTWLTLPATFTHQTDTTTISVPFEGEETTKFYRLRFTQN